MSQLSQIEMNMIMNGKMKESIYKRLEEIGLYSYDVGNRRKWYYSNPDLQNGYVEEEKEIQVVFVDWMGSMTEMWVDHDFSLHPVWYKIIKNDRGADVTMYSGSFNLGSEPNTWADYCLYVHSDVDKMKQTLIDRLGIVMRDIKSVEKKIKKHAIAKSAGTYDAT